VLGVAGHGWDGLCVAQLGRARQGVDRNGLARQGYHFYNIEELMDNASNRITDTKQNGSSNSGVNGISTDHVRQVRGGQPNEIALVAEDLSDPRVRRTMPTDNEHRFILVRTQHELGPETIAGLPKI
jgi:hypothetical protein